MTDGPHSGPYDCDYDCTSVARLSLVHKLITNDRVEAGSIHPGTEHAIVLVGDILEADAKPMLLAVAECRAGSQVERCIAGRAAGNETYVTEIC